MDKQQIIARIREIEPRVAEHLDRGGRPRGLTPEEKRLALQDVVAFEEVVQARQAETLEAMRLSAELDTLRDDLAAIERQEATEAEDALREELDRLLQSREGAAIELEELIRGMADGLEDFMALNQKISALDRRLGQADRHRGGHGLVALALKRMMHATSPTLARMAGIPYAAPKDGWSLSGAFRVHDPLD